MSDRELAAKAIDEHEAWKARNAARLALRKFFKAYRADGGEYFDRAEMVRWGELEDVAKFDALTAEVKATQRALTTKRAATRRAIVRAAAEIGKTK